MSNDKTRTITGPFGRFTRKKNGLIYFYKEDDISMDEFTVANILEVIHELDDIAPTRLLVIQGHRVEYTFDAQRLLFTSDRIGKLAYVIETTTQQLTAELLQDMAKTLRAPFPVGIFEHIERAEMWLLEAE